MVACSQKLPDTLTVTMGTSFDRCLTLNTVMYLMSMSRAAVFGSIVLTDVLQSVLLYAHPALMCWPTVPGLA